MIEKNLVAQVQVRRLLRRPALIWFSWTALALMLATSTYLRQLAEGRDPSFLRLLRSALLDYWIWAALTSVVLFLARRFRFQRGRLPQAIIIHTFASILLSFAHVSLAQVLGVQQPVFSHLPFVLARFLRDLYSDLWMYWTIVAIWNVFAFQKESRERATNELQLQMQLARAQLETLRIQLQPHFLFNTLNSISALIREDGAAAEDMISDLSYMLRVCLRRSGENEILLSEELEFLNAYLRIQMRRFEDKLRVSVQAAPGAARAYVPSLLLQPLVENAVHHGISPKIGNGNITVTAAQINDRLVLTVADDGVGLGSGYEEGIGLSNTRERLRYLYGAQHNFNVADNNGVTVTIEIPFRTSTRQMPATLIEGIADMLSTSKSAH